MVLFVPLVYFVVLKMGLMVLKQGDRDVDNCDD